MLAGIIVSIASGHAWRGATIALSSSMSRHCLGAFLGAKVVYILAEGWMHFGAPDVWLQLATGKSILGGAVGRLPRRGNRQARVGLSRCHRGLVCVHRAGGIILGRIGCLLHGCCLGRECEPSWFTLRDSTGTAALARRAGGNTFQRGCHHGFFILRRKPPAGGPAFSFVFDWLRRRFVLRMNFFATRRGWPAQ